jgi:hypothetical protein
MDRFQQLLWDLGELIELPLHLDKHNACKLLIDEKLPVQIEIDPEKEQLLVAGMIAELPPGRFRENVLKETLKLNATYHPFGIFAFVEKINILVLYKYLLMSDLNGEKLTDFLEIFVDELVSWNSAITSGNALPPQYFKPPPLPKTP